MLAHGISAEEATVGALMWKEHSMWRSKGPSMGARNKNSSLVLEGVGLHITSLPFSAPRDACRFLYSLLSTASHLRIAITFQFLGVCSYCSRI